MVIASTIEGISPVSLGSLPGLIVIDSAMVVLQSDSFDKVCDTLKARRFSLSRAIFARLGFSGYCYIQYCCMCVHFVWCRQALCLNHALCLMRRHTMITHDLFANASHGLLLFRDGLSSHFVTTAPVRVDWPW